jgi:hypothetical protein
MMLSGMIRHGEPPFASMVTNVTFVATFISRNFLAGLPTWLSALRPLSRQNRKLPYLRQLKNGGFGKTIRLYGFGAHYDHLWPQNGGGLIIR